MLELSVSTITSLATYISCGFITILGLVCTVRMLQLRRHFSVFHASLRNKLYNRNGYIGIGFDEQGIPRVEPSYWASLLEEKTLRDEYAALSMKYLSWVQNIGLFPMWGILGTIVGLTLNVMLSDDAITMLSSLGTALLTTLLGLIFAILLKIIDAYGILPLLYSIEGEFDGYENLFANLRLEETSLATDLARRVSQRRAGEYDEARIRIRTNEMTPDGSDIMAKPPVQGKAKSKSQAGGEIE